MTTKDDLLDLIPRYKHDGTATNEGLREIDRLLNTFTFNEQELGLLREEILCLTPERVFKKRAKEESKR